MPCWSNYLCINTIICMLTIFQTLRGKLIFSFGIFMLLLIAVIITNIWQEIGREKIDRIISNLTDAERELQEANRLQHLFFSNETINPKFYITGESEYLIRRKLALKDLANRLKRLERSQAEILINGEETIEDAIQLVKQNDLLFDSLVVLVKRRGFKDWGVVGDMRRCIHRIEERSQDLDKVLLLMIRRHEKDFIIRKDMRYVQKLRKKVVKLRVNIEETLARNPEKRDTLLQLLDEYQSLFNQLVECEEKIGFYTRDEDGLRYRISSLSEKLVKDIDQIHEQAFEETEKLHNRMYWSSAAIMVGCLSFGFIIALFISKALGEPFEKLSRDIHKAVKENFAPTIQVEELSSRDEIGRLSKDVSFMLRQVQDSMHTIQEASQKIADKQEQLLDSLRYAEQIQQAILPSDASFRNCLKEYFVLYRPQNVVSGDFYWLVKRKGIIFVAVVDCTGHGVPGAFMSMIGNTLLNKIVVQSKILSPEIILESLHVEVLEALKQESGKYNKRTNEGMDVSLCSIERGKSGCVVTFAGAKNSLFYTDAEGALHRVKGTSRSIGEVKKQDRIFESETILMPEGSRLYLCSDGFADQHNMEGRKFSTRRLIDVLSKLSTLPMADQNEQLAEILDEHQGEQEQRDDITVLGIEL